KRTDKLWERADDPWFDLKPAKSLLIGQHEILIEVFAQFLLPLGKKRLRSQYQRRANDPAKGKLFVNETRLDSLAQADVIGEDGSRRFLAQDLLNHAKLIGVRPDTVVEHRWRQ